jgi:tetratricopeptide (TPR) repeat protein
LLLLQIAAAQDAAPEAFQLGLGLQQRGLHADAARQFEEFLRGSPRHPLAAEANYRRGVSLAETGDHANAAKALRQALQVGRREFALAIECRYRLTQALGAGGDADAPPRSTNGCWPTCRPTTICWRRRAMARPSASAIAAATRRR